MSHRLAAIAVAAGLALQPQLVMAQPNNPSTIRFVPARAPIGSGRLIDGAHVEVKGVIAADSPKELARALAQARKQADSFSLGGQPVIRVFLNSPGGDVVAAIAMGRLLRLHAADVWVDQGHTCASACILILAGGVDRWAVSPFRLGIHRPRFDQVLFAGLSYEESQKRYAALANGVRRYLAEMGIGDELYQAMMRIPSNELRYLDQSVAERTALLGKDPAHEEWERARAVERHGSDFIERLDAYVKCVNDGGTDNECSSKTRLNRAK